MKVTHASKKTGTIENKKIKKVIDTANERIESRIIELTQQGKHVSSLHVEEIKNIVYESTEKKKGRTLGLGFVPITQALSVASTSLNREMQNIIFELQEADAAKEAEIHKLRIQMEVEVVKRDELLDWLRTKHGYPN